MVIVDFKECIFQKDGKDYPYYKAVFTEGQKDYSVKKITKEVYDSLSDQNVRGVNITRLLYDEYGKVCEIEY